MGYRRDGTSGRLRRDDDDEVPNLAVLLIA
jgi:hypothetical protein